MTDQQDDITVFEVSSGFGHRTQEPYVQVIVHRADFMTQMPPQTARELAMNLLTCADAAESDGFLVGFVRKVMRNVIGAENPEAVAQILMEFRAYREARREEPIP